jgi:hypothetical protein
LLPAVVGSVLWLASCSDVKNAVAIDYTYNLPRVTFSYPPAFYKSGEQVIYSGQYYMNLDSILHSNGFSSGVVGTTTFTKCLVAIDLPADANFAWLQSSRMEISKSAVFDSTLEVGYITDIDPTTRTLDYTMTKVNIRPYLGNQAFYFRLLGTLKVKSPATSAQMHIDGQLVMRLQPLN